MPQNGAPTSSLMHTGLCDDLLLVQKLPSHASSALSHSQQQMNHELAQYTEVRKRKRTKHQSIARAHWGYLRYQVYKNEYRTRHAHSHPPKSTPPSARLRPGACYQVVLSIRYLSHDPVCPTMPLMPKRCKESKTKQSHNAFACNAAT